MNGQLAERWRMALTGAAGAAFLWALVEAVERDMLGDRLALILLTLVATGFAALLAMAGPIGLGRAVPRALGLGVVVAALVWLAGLRHAEVDGLFASPLPPLAGLAVASLPVPFLIAGARNGWRDYPALFLEAWSIVVRYAAAWAFVGLLWLVIFLSDQVLLIVGVTVIGDLLDHWIVPAVITGAALGLGMAVVYELADLLSPYLVLRLFRILLPIVLAVMLVFLAALPFRGLEGLFNGLSPALLLLTMVAAGVSLVSVTVDQSDADATQSPVLRRAAQGMALILPVLGGLAAYAIWLRVDQHGWTPERLFVALVAVLGLVYGAVYALAVLRGEGWMARIRQGNIGMALLVIVVAGLWLTPILNAERISANNQLTRFEAGKTAVADLDIRAMEGWGLPGERALALLTERAQEPGQEALAARLAGVDDPATAGLDADARAEAARVLSAAMPVQPTSATGTRDMLLSAAETYMLADWQVVCDRRLEDGAPACLMVVADLLPTQPGEEAVLILEREPSYVEVLGLFMADDGMLLSRSVMLPDGSYLATEDAAALLRDWAKAPPPLTPALLNQLGTGETGLMIRP
ncbi:DUF4153 domain-containing protein [Tabrizicola piscis]|uniref:DUF4153 domain-containing protein n=1 Tax=Tabrizicola piscis TaxID=2494374 RepID=A0A3S8U477_9RHOB|nr:DUF4153 domain-containing protein [Tabrizicola piscis]AZL58378.1 DUF4153 domain-containing protein [Tabrizicola piscis]